MFTMNLKIALMPKQPKVKKVPRLQMEPRQDFHGAKRIRVSRISQGPSRYLE
jgi:hypothetical protein